MHTCIKQVVHEAYVQSHSKKKMLLPLFISIKLAISSQGKIQKICNGGQQILFDWAIKFVKYELINVHFLVQAMHSLLPFPN